LPTRAADGKTMCIAYHVRGRCHTGCTLPHDHAPHTVADDDALYKWCDANWAPSA
jgi:hypothetical protein